MLVDHGVVDGAGVVVVGVAGLDRACRAGRRRGLSRGRWRVAAVVVTAGLLGGRRVGEVPTVPRPTFAQRSAGHPTSPLGGTTPERAVSAGRDRPAPGGRRGTAAGGRCCRARGPGPPRPGGARRRAGPSSRAARRRSTSGSHHTSSARPGVGDRRVEHRPCLVRCARRCAMSATNVSQYGIRKNAPWPAARRCRGARSRALRAAARPAVEHRPPLAVVGEAVALAQLGQLGHRASRAGRSSRSWWVTAS